MLQKKLAFSIICKQQQKAQLLLDTISKMLLIEMKKAVTVPLFHVLLIKAKEMSDTRTLENKISLLPTSSGICFQA